MRFMSWTVALEHLADELENIVLERVHDVAMDAAEELIERTPVDTGRARRNWYAGTRGDIVRQVWRGQPGAYFHMPMSARERYNTLHNIRTAKLGEVIHISQSMPYMAKIETGQWSKMAPNGVLHVGTHAVSSRWRRRRDKVKVFA